MQGAPARGSLPASSPRAMSRPRTSMSAFREGAGPALVVHGGPFRNHRPQRAGRRARLRRSLPVDLRGDFPDSAVAGGLGQARSSIRSRRTVGRKPQPRGCPSASAGRDRRLMALAAHKRRAGNEIGNLNSAKRRKRHGDIRQSDHHFAPWTGAIHTPTMSPYLPITPDQIAEEAIAAGRSGRRHPASARLATQRTGKPDQTARGVRAVSCRASSRAPTRAINITHRRQFPTCALEEAREAQRRPSSRKSLLSTWGSINFGLLSSPRQVTRPSNSIGERDRIWRRRARSSSSATAFKDIEFILATCYEKRDRASSSNVTTSRISTISRISPIASSSRPPFFVQFRLRPARRHWHASRRRRATCVAPPIGCSAAANRWSVPGRRREPIADRRASRRRWARNIRVGLEDSLWAGRGKLAKFERRTGSRSRARSSKGWARRSRLPDEAREILFAQGRRQRSHF